MIELAVLNEAGEKVGSVELDEARLGKRVRPNLLKQAIVMYQANRRQGTAANRSRGQTEGSTRKLYRQKGTGNARVGPVRSPIRRGGGRAFAKRARDFSKDMPKRMRRLARDNAILAKALANDVIVLDKLEYDAPKTKRFAAMLSALGADRGCIVALEQASETVWKSGRNIPRVDICPFYQLNAYDILRRPKLVLTRGALAALVAGDGAGPLQEAGASA